MFFRSLEHIEQGIFIAYIDGSHTFDFVVSVGDVVLGVITTTFKRLFEKDLATTDLKDSNHY